ncbi:hypothetical protein C0J52_11389 [Blattella germanica]|nr:hypothetical protein C0J52_11389 [Blattella germanica]
MEERMDSQSSLLPPPLNDVTRNSYRSERPCWMEEGKNRQFYCIRNIRMDGAGGYSGSGDDGTGTRTQNPGGNKRLQQTQAKVDEVVEIMQINVQNLMQRGERLEVMGERADALQQGAAQFEQQAGKLKRKYWWKNLKMMIIMAVIALIIIVIIISKYCFSF